MKKSKSKSSIACPSARRSVATGSASVERDRHYQWIKRVTADYARMYLGDSSPGHIELESARISNLCYQHAPGPEQLTPREAKLRAALEKIAGLSTSQTAPDEQCSAVVIAMDVLGLG